MFIKKLSYARHRKSAQLLKGQFCVAGCGMHTRLHLVGRREEDITEAVTLPSGPQKAKGNGRRAFLVKPAVPQSCRMLL